MDRVLELYTPDVILDTGGVLLPAGVHRGIGEVREALMKIASERTLRSPRHLDLEVSGDWVLAVSHLDDSEHCCLFRLRDGLIAQIECPPTVEEGRRRLKVGAVGHPDPLWAPLGGKEFLSGHLELEGHGADLCFDGRRMPAALPPEIAACVSSGEAALVFLDDGKLLGWYLPERQLGVDLRDVGEGRD